jgi:hypothetical protein
MIFYPGGEKAVCCNLSDHENALPQTIVDAASVEMLISFGKV